MMPRAIFFVGVALILSGCGMCNNMIKKEIDSPDGLKKIVIFVRDCGATTAYSTQISILDKNARLPNCFGNTFVSEFSDPVNATWVGLKQVEVTYHKGGRISFRISDVSGIAVKYIQR